MSDVVISVNNLGKEYRLGTISHGTLYRDLQSWWARIRGQEDPNAKITDTQMPKNFNERFWALNDVSFEVNQGDIVGIVGRNGAGKSTLLKILSRTTAPSTGNVKIKGKISSLLEVGTGFHPELTGRENVYLNGAIHGLTRREVSKKFDEIVAFSEIEKFIDTPVKRYSSGMYVRLAFAVAAHLEPDILIVDEVLAVGDSQFQTKCLGKMEEVGRQGRTVLVVSHNLSTVKRLCTKGILLEKGQLTFRGEIDDVLATYVAKGSQDNAIFEKELVTDKDVALTRVELHNKEGKPQSHIPYDEPCSIKVNYTLNKAISNLTVWIGIETVESTMVFVSCDYDGDHSLLGQRHAGNYTATMELPSHLLNTGKYKVVVGINTNGVNLVEFERAETVVFEIEQIGHLGSVISDVNTRAGFIQPRMQWETVRNT